jgi:hexosaminidase
VVTRRDFLSLTGGVALATGAIGVGSTPVLAADAAPPTIPALRSWTPGSGQFSLTSSSRIVLNSGDGSQLQTAADVLAEDLRKITGWAIPVTTGTPATGDIQLSYTGSATGLDAEAYELKVGAVLEVRGPKSGAFWGTRTLVQWFRQDRTIPGGTAQDRPSYPDRGLLVANVAKHYTMTWWQGQIQELSYLKLNMLWLSAGYDSTPVAEIQAIAAYAARYNVTVVPLFNMPGHMDKPLTGHEDMQLPGQPGNLDLSKDAAYPFARDLLAPLLSAFNTPEWHLGSDEYLIGSSYPQFPQLGQYAKQHYGQNAVPQDCQYGFLNYIHPFVTNSGKRMRVWNDGISTSATVQIDHDIVVEHWVHYDGLKTPEQLVNEGYEVSNSNQDYLYYSNAGQPPTAQTIYDGFQVGLFQGNHVIPANSPQLRGAKISLWTLPVDETEEQESDGLANPLRSLSQLVWGSPKPAPTYWGGFGAIIDVTRRPPGFPYPRFRPNAVDGSTSFAPGKALAVTFWDAVDANSISLTLKTSAGATVPGSMSYNASNKTATFTPASALSWVTSYTATLIATAVRDDGIPPAPVQTSWRFTTARQPWTGNTLSLWQDSDEPSVIASSDGNEVELGLKFRSDVDGSVAGVRFYKAAGNVGAHIATLWTAAGAKLATAAAGSESTAGWQEIRFPSPVQIAGNTTYVVSYHAPNGQYGAANGAFTNAGKDNGVLHALRSGVDGPNGLFAYGPSKLPTESYEDSNYWMDPIFVLPNQQTMFANSESPALVSGDSAAVELGVKFRADIAGQVTGLRFHKAAGNIGTHVGSLWASNGTKLGAVTFTNESTSGWQEVSFAMPIQVQPNTTYLASYYAPQGRFSVTNGMFTTAGRDSRNLHALKSGVDGLNGVFVYGSSAFPTQSFEDSNYWVDVVFKS